MKFPPILARIRNQLGRIFRMPFSRKPAPPASDGEARVPTGGEPTCEAEAPLASGETPQEVTAEAASASTAPETIAPADLVAEPTPEANSAAKEVPRDYEAIGRVAVVHPVELPRAASGRTSAVYASAGNPVAPPGGPVAPMASTHTSGAGPASSGHLPSQAPVPSGVLNMHRLQQVPPNQRQAQFRVSEYPGPETEDYIDVTDDLYGYVARTINLKLRISAAKQEG